VELSKDKLALEENFSDALRLGLEDFAKAISIDLKYWFSFRKEPFYLGLGNRQMAVDSYIKRKSDSYTSLSQTDLAFDESKTDNPKEENALNPTSYEATFAQSSVDSSSDHDTHGNSESSEGFLENVNGESEKLVPEDVFLNPVEDREHKTVASSSITPQKDELSNLVDSKVGALYKRGKLNRELGEQSNALDDYTAAITLSPGFAAAIYERALCYVSLEKDELALEDFSNAIALEPVYWSSLRKEQFYLDLGVRRADVEKYISLRCSAYDNVTGNTEFTDVMESHDIFEMDQDERSTASPRIFRWASSFTKLFRKTNL
jgi:tetratricopeptide (TPR) repeat protein